MKTLREYIDQLDEISRRDFLKGAGATAGLAATDAIAAPFIHGQNVDPMTNKVQGSRSTVVSNDGLARLYIQWNSGDTGVWLELNQGRLGYDSVAGGFPLQNVRIKLGSGPVENTYGTIGKDFKSMQIGSPNESKKLANRILKHSGEIKVEAELRGGNTKVFKFTIEQDAVTRSQAQAPTQQQLASVRQAMAMEEESLDEASDDAIKRIEELTKYK
jgi:hypothetical protein